MAIGIAEVGERQRPLLARTQHDVAVDQDILDLSPIGAAVHAHEAANGAGDRAEEFEPRDTRIARGRGHEDARCAAAAAQRRRIDGFDFREGFAEADDDARSEEHTSELQSLMRISYAVFCLKKKKT